MSSFLLLLFLQWMDTADTVNVVELEFGADVSVAHDTVRCGIFLLLLYHHFFLLVPVSFRTSHLKSRFAVIIAVALSVSMSILCCTNIRTTKK